MEHAAALENFSQRLLQVQDEERRKLSRDLHDRTGQTLVALRIGVTVLEEKCNPDPSTKTLLLDLASLADQALIAQHTDCATPRPRMFNFEHSPHFTGLAAYVACGNHHGMVNIDQACVESRCSIGSVGPCDGSDQVDTLQPPRFPSHSNVLKSQRVQS